MNSERNEEFCEQRPSSNLPVAELESDDGSSDRAILVAATDQADAATATRSSKAGADATQTTHDQENAGEKDAQLPTLDVSTAKLRMQNRLPGLEDDGDVGAQKEYIVTRDDKADLRFNGILLASAAPAIAVKGHWQEYRIYQTDGNKHVFARVKRTVFVGEDDAYEAEVFDPSPSSVSSQLLRSAREITRSRPLTWMDAAAAFFGYDPLAKALYRKLNVRFEEHIS